MDDRNAHDSAPSRTRRVLSLALWLVLILAVAIGIARLATRSRRPAPVHQNDYSNLFHIEAVVSDDSFAVTIKNRWPTIDEKHWCVSTLYLVSGNDRVEMGSTTGSFLGSGSTRETFPSVARDKPVRVVIEYRVFGNTGPTTTPGIRTAPSGPLLYQGRVESQLINFPVIAREQPGWAKDE